MPHLGIQTVTVPGCVEGWSKLHRRFGKLPWNELFQPAIYYADHGYPLTEMIQAVWGTEVKALSGDENASRIFLRDGRSTKDPSLRPLSRPARDWAAP
jgi:gamma-glutamyltranspeptidase/glutathione hydrolase